MRIGVIGIGIMGEYHTRVYREITDSNPDVQFKGVADIDKNRIHGIAKKYRTECYTDYKELLDSGVDAVSICVPTHLHKKVAIDAIEKGIRAILIEKPISDNISDALDIVNFARDKGVILTVGHVERFNPAVLLMKKIIGSGRLGRVVSISAKRVGPGPPRYKDTGVIVDLAVHDLDIICYLYCACPTDVYAVAGEGKNGLEDRASIMLKFDGQRAGFLETNWLTSHKIRTLDIVGLEAVAHLDYIDQTITISEHEKEEEIKFSKQEPLMNELSHFINVVSGKETPLVTGEDGIQALRLALASVESYRAGSVQRLCELPKP
ncbi:Gfo/Idh/MocA family oxidoreductase [Patescibacteria group bacterium]|nr:Gfo/Idh/MocA family oxidoreductase [Patescibacteria group bacterium]